MILTEIREVIGIPAIYTQDGAHYAEGGGSSWRIRNLFPAGQAIDCTINLAGALAPTTDSFDNGTAQPQSIILIAPSVNMTTFEPNVLPIYVSEFGIMAILQGCLVERFTLSGVSLGVTDINLENTIAPNFIINTKTIGFQNIDGLIGAICFAGYGTNPLNGDFVIGEQARFSFNTIEIVAGVTNSETFPSDYTVPNNNVFSVYNALQMNSYGADCFAAFGFFDGVKILLTDPVVYMAQDYDSRIGGGAFPSDFPIDLTAMTTTQSAVYTGYGDAFAGCSVWVVDVVAQSIFVAARGECYIQNHQVNTTNTVDFFPLVYYTTNNETGNLTIYPEYNLDGESIQFDDDSQQSFFLCATGNIGVLVQATNGRFFYLSSGFVPPAPSKPKKQPRTYSCANYSRLI